MDTHNKDKIKNLVLNKRVMTLAVSHDDLPWASPVYFVWANNAFFFFSNESSRHIRYSEGKNSSATIFHDSDVMSEIFGMQMSGNIKRCKNPVSYMSVVKTYIRKFEFLTEAFEIKSLLSKNFFKDKFNSYLYGFYPETVFLSDNSKGNDKQVQLKVKQLNNLVN